MADSLELPKDPRDTDYEEFIAAYLQAGGLYVERHAIFRKEAELLELDILTTDFSSEQTTKHLIEIKSGDWGFNEIFKLRGWLTFLSYEQGCFVVKKSRDYFDFYRESASRLNIHLIDNSDQSETSKHLDGLLKFEPDEDIVQAIRWSYRIERDLLRRLKGFKKISKGKKGYAALDDYYYRVNSQSLFFSPDSMSRIHSLFKAYLDNRNITARISKEDEGGDFDSEANSMTSSAFKSTYYKAEINIYQVSIMVEHLTRLSVLKCCVEHLIERLKGTYDSTSINAIFDEIMLPANIRVGLEEMVKDKYFHLYPRFWQFFTYVFGGFILLDLETEELELLSGYTRIPIEHIPDAFEAFNKLFPRKNGWFYSYPNSRIKAHHFFPIAFSGIGANFRRFLHTEDSTLRGSNQTGQKTLYNWRV